MTNTKLNIIKLNIITAILPLIFISCIPDNQVNPDLNNNTNPEITQRFKDKSQESKNPVHSYQEYQNLKIEIEKHQGNTAAKLQAIKNYLENQKKKETEGVAKVDAEIAKVGTQSDFLKTFTTNSNYATSEKDLLLMKRIIYSSLYYNTTIVKKLYEILEKLNANPQHKEVVTNLLYRIALGTQLELDKHLETITKEPLPPPPNQEKYEDEEEELLEFSKNDLKRKDSFGKALNKTINDYNSNFDKIKTDVGKLASYMNKQFSSYDFQ
ncbi:complement regulator-acquiring protein (plasmid) [Borreliella yangtzensis]|uniref:complement regulator-acquiring protein n=1 Tax=Borreliella yangtzensis TaxID=683292 RepID=UPI002649890F|nr:complement regulator-acquiring protein [Borreliella yangtzensis]WKC74842.1 complement regulator-acquiring protein [Borreliella yangtzensis]